MKITKRHVAAVAGATAVGALGAVVVKQVLGGGRGARIAGFVLLLVAH